MKLRNPFKKLDTVATVMDQIRPIVSRYRISEAYINYDFMKDITTDRPDYIWLTYSTAYPNFTFENDDLFRQELKSAFGKRVVPFAAAPNNRMLILARDYFEPLFSDLQ